MRPVAEIYLNNLINNFNYINSKTNNSKVFAVVKANAYGHGVKKISKTLQELEAPGLCVATIEELIEIRNANIDIPILHLGILNKEKIELYNSKNNICTINSIDDINLINNFLKGSREKIYCHLKIDTGMNRLGISLDHVDEILKLIKNNNNIKLLGMYSHFSSSDEDDDSIMKLQLEQFKKNIDIAESLIPEVRDYHISNSTGLLKCDSNALSLVRTGISLYGVNNTKVKHNLNPVMKLKAPVVFIKNIKNGDAVGYNRKFIASKDSRVAYLQIGYADGYPLEMINAKTVFYKGKLLNVLGKVSMDLTAIDCSDTNIRIGEYVTLFGEDENKLEIICSDMMNTPYSILTGLGNRVLREYVND